MTGAEAEKRGKRSAGRWVAAMAAVYLVGFGVLAAAGSRCMGGRALAVMLALSECVVIAVATVLLCGVFDARRMGLLRWFARVMGGCGAVACASVVVLAVARVGWGAGPMGGVVLAQVVILAFCGLVAGVFALVRELGELPAAGLVSVVVACALMGTVFYADPVVEWPEGGAAREGVIAWVLGVNPLVCVSGVLGFDLMRQPLMYDKISVIGRWYQTPYPAWWMTSGGYVVAAGVLLAAAGLVRRGKRKLRIED